MKIYTKTGDKGLTSLFNGTRVGKDDLRVEAYGTVDELNSILGVVLAELEDSRFKIQELSNELIKIQEDLLELGAFLANPDAVFLQEDKTYFSERIRHFEAEIDRETSQMPLLANFVLPSGGKAAAFFHLARTVARRAERKIVKLNRNTPVAKEVIMYFNRLSDFLFTMARFSNFKEGQKENIWNKR